MYQTIYLFIIISIHVLIAGEEVDPNSDGVTGWLRIIRSVLSGSRRIVEAMVVQQSSVLVHCRCASGFKFVIIILQALAIN